MDSTEIRYPHYIVRTWYAVGGRLTSIDQTVYGKDKAVGHAQWRAENGHLSVAELPESVDVFLNAREHGALKHITTIPGAGNMRATVALKYGYKIHGFKTANGESASTNTVKFYATYDEALRAAERCVSKGCDEGIVIYKAVKLVRPVRPEVRIEEIDIRGE